MKNSRFPLVLGLIGLGFIVCIMNTTNERRERTERRRDRQERSYRSVECQPIIEYRRPAPRVSTQFNWTHAHGRSGFNVSYTIGTPACRSCYVVREQRYYVQPVSTYSYYF